MTAAGEEGLLVHECTHAAVDQQEVIKTVFRLDNEIMAFMAQALYVLNKGGRFTSTDPAMLQEASTVAEKIKDKPGASLSSDDVAGLAAAIKGDADYKAIKKNPKLKDKNDGVPL
jgi:hypothetical protein